MPVSFKTRYNAKSKGTYRRGAIAANRRYQSLNQRISRSFRSAPTVGQLRNRAAMMGTAVPETKVLDNNTTSSGSVFGGAGITPGNNFTPVALNLIQTGSSFFNRIGRKVRNHSIFIEMWAAPNGTNAQTDVAYHRFLVVYDRQSNGATPSITDVLQDVDQSNNLTSGTSLATAHLNMNNRERFVVLMDERKVLPPIASSAPYFTSPVVTTEDTFKIKRFIPLKMLETHYKADSSPSVIGDVATGALIFIALSDKAAANCGYEWQGSFRLKFDDM